MNLVICNLTPVEYIYASSPAIGAHRSTHLLLYLWKMFGNTVISMSLQRSVVLLACIHSVFAWGESQNIQPIPMTNPNLVPTNSFLPVAVLNATRFEACNRAHGHVYDDPFYIAPNGSEHAQPGTLLKVEDFTNTSLYTIPAGLSMSRFMYQSKASSNRSIPVSGYILWPYASRRTDAESIPWIAWAHGLSGISADCAPSNIRNLWQHFLAPFELSLQGYAVVATDYAGLGVQYDANGSFITHEYLAGPAEANDVYYGILAAKAAFSSLSEEFVIMGHSQGGGAAWATAEKLASEPIAGHLGTIAIAPSTRILDMPANYGIINVVGLLLIPSISIKSPSFNPNSVTTEQGREALRTLLDLQGCSSVLFELTTGTGIMTPGWQNTSTYQEWQKFAAVGRRPFHGPLLVIQGDSDAINYPATTTQTVVDTATLFPSTQIEHHTLPNIDHEPSLFASQVIWQSWINARFAGQGLQPGLRNYTEKPLRPANSVQSEPNWYMTLAEAQYQLT